MNELINKRTIASQPFSFKAYEDNYSTVMKMCEASGRKPGEELRDLLDEGIRARMSRTSESSNATTDGTGQREDEITQLFQVTQQMMQKTNLQADMMLRMILHLREQYALVLEAVAAGYAARHLIWKYVVETVLRDEGLSPEQIIGRLNEERRTWNAERDHAADTLEQAIRNLGLGIEDSS